MKILADNGIYTGVIFMPQLPFINDNWDETEELITKAKESGANYLMYTPALTLREGSREYFYKNLDQHFPGIKKKYEQAFGNDYICPSPNATELYSKAKILCKKLQLPLKINHYSPNTPNQLTMF